MNLQLDEWQRKFLDTQGDKILCTGRQVGKSVVCAIDAVEYGIRHPKETIVIIAPLEKQAYSLYEKILGYVSQNYPHQLVKKGKQKPTKEKFKLMNGTEFICSAVGATGLGVRFLTIHRLYIDEMSRLPDSVISAITPTMFTTSGNKIYLSTPAGAEGEFYRCWKNKNGAYNSFTRFSITSEDVAAKRPISESWSEKQRENALREIENAKKRMSKREYSQEFCGEFISDLHKFFSDQIINACCVGSKQEHISPDGVYYLGVDVARMGDDPCQFEIVQRKDEKRYIHVASIMMKKVLLNEVTQKILTLHALYNFKKIYIDDGGIGVGVFDYLLTDESIQDRVVAVNNRARPIDWKQERSKKLLKEDLYNNLLGMMERGEIILLDEELVRESLHSVQYEYIMKEGEPTRLHIFGNYTHITEGLIRACCCTMEKYITLWVRYTGDNGGI